MMPQLPVNGAKSELLKEIKDKLSPYIDKEVMRDLDNNLHLLFNEMRAQAHHAVYLQIAKLIEDGKLVHPNEAEQ